MGVPVWLLQTRCQLDSTTMYMLRLAERLPEHGFDPTIVCASSAGVPPRIGGALEILELPELAVGWWRGLALRRLIAARGDRRPALVHAQRRDDDALAMEFADCLGCPYLLTVHDIIPTGESVTVRPDKLGAIIAVCPSVERDLIQQASLPADWVHLIPSGVEMPEAPATIPLHSPKRIPVVGMASALEPVSGATFFLMAVELILSAGYDVEFLIAGAGPDEEILRRAARHLDIANRVTFVGAPFAVADLLAALDVFVVASLQEGLGAMMLEAMALGKPVVATKVGGIADFFEDGEHALLVPRANHVALADKIKHLLDNPGRAAKLAANGQRYVRDQFDVDRMVRDTARLYRDVLAKRQPAVAEVARLP